MSRGAMAQRSYQAARNINRPRFQDVLNELDRLVNPPFVKTSTQFREYIQPYAGVIIPTDAATTLEREFKQTQLNVKNGYLHTSSKLTSSIQKVYREHGFQAMCLFFGSIHQYANSTHWTYVLQNISNNVDHLDSLYHHEAYTKLIHYIRYKVPLDDLLTCQVISYYIDLNDLDTAYRLYKETNYLDIPTTLKFLRKLSSNYNRNTRKMGLHIALQFYKNNKLEPKSLQEVMGALPSWGYTALLWKILPNISTYANVLTSRTLAFAIDTCAESSQLSSCADIANTYSFLYKSAFAPQAFASLISALRRANLSQLATLWSCVARTTPIPDEHVKEYPPYNPSDPHAVYTPLLSIRKHHSNATSRNGFHRALAHMNTEHAILPCPMIGITTVDHVSSYSMIHKPQEYVAKNAFLSSLPSISKLQKYLLSVPGNSMDRVQALIEYLQPFVNLATYALAHPDSYVVQNVLNYCEEIHTMRQSVLGNNNNGTGVSTRFTNRTGSDTTNTTPPATTTTTSSTHGHHASFTLELQVQSLVDLGDWTSVNTLVQSNPNIHEYNITKLVLLDGLLARFHNVSKEKMTNNIKSKYLQPLLQLGMLDEYAPNAGRWTSYIYALVHGFDQGAVDWIPGPIWNTVQSLVPSIELPLQIVDPNTNTKVQLTQGKYLARQQFGQLLSIYLKKHIPDINNPSTLKNILERDIHTLQRFVSGLAELGEFEEVTWYRNILSALGICNDKIQLEWLKSCLKQEKYAKYKKDSVELSSFKYWVKPTTTTTTSATSTTTTTNPETETEEVVPDFSELQQQLYTIYQDIHGDSVFNRVVARMLSRELASYGDLQAALFWIALTSTEDVNTVSTTTTTTSNLSDQSVTTTEDTFLDTSANNNSASEPDSISSSMEDVLTTDSNTSTSTTTTIYPDFSQYTIPAEPTNIYNPYRTLHQYILDTSVSTSTYPESIGVLTTDDMKAPSIADIFSNSPDINVELLHSVPVFQTLPTVCPSETLQRHYKALLEACVIRSMIPEATKLFKLLLSSVESNIVSSINGQKYLYEQYLKERKEQYQQALDADVLDDVSGASNTANTNTTPTAASTDNNMDDALNQRFPTSEIWSEMITAVSAWKQNPEYVQQYPEEFAWFDQQIKSLVDSWLIAGVPRTTALRILQQHGISDISRVHLDDASTTSLDTYNIVPSDWPVSVSCIQTLDKGPETVPITTDVIPSRHTVLGCSVNVYPLPKLVVSLMEYFKHDAQALGTVTKARTHWFQSIAPSYPAIRNGFDQRVDEEASRMSLPTTTGGTSCTLVLPQQTYLHQYIHDILTKCPSALLLDTKTKQEYDLNVLLTQSLHVNSLNIHTIMEDLLHQCKLVDSENTTSIPIDVQEDLSNWLDLTGPELHQYTTCMLQHTDSEQVKAVLSKYKHVMECDTSVQQVTLMMNTMLEKGKSKLLDAFNFAAKQKLYMTLRNLTKKQAQEQVKPPHTLSSTPIVTQKLSHDLMKVISSITAKRTKKE